ncbi:MAG: WD40 repeat domain-containing protein [Candidatus Endonucleobacter bathymodioli]|uniref:WD40 repeat domain-containing protein n=1 Tax=Candidatus Endonucleibacter bathymodioli TaxID=539814 RepID=A0AA90NV82_9GAMM|nr:WD40 repeat domain-containing protein [Candidatus Endonucleobacter bathymodioli]
MVKLFIVTLSIVLSGTSIHSLGVLPKDSSELTIDETVRESFQQSNLDSISENSEELDAFLSDKEIMLSEWLSNLSINERDIFKNDIITSNREKFIASISEVTNNKEIRDILISYYTVSRHEVFQPREVLKFKLVQKVGVHCNNTDSFGCFSEDSRYLVITGCDDTIIILVNEDGKWREERTIFIDDTVLSVCFSLDSHHMIVTLSSKGIKIYSLGIDNKWTESGIINLEVQSAFSPDSRHLVVWHGNHVGVWNLSEHGVWIGDLTTRIDSLSAFFTGVSVYFTDDSLYLVVSDGDKPVLILNLEQNGSWVVSKVSTPPCHKIFLPPTSWNDDLYMVSNISVGNNKNVAAVLRLRADGEWIGKYIFTEENPVYAVGTNADGLHIATTGGGTLAKIWSLGTDGGLKGKDILRDKQDSDNEECIEKFSTSYRSVDTMEFSKDCCHLVVICDDQNIIICSQNGDGEWIEKKAINTDEAFVRVVTFSPDGTHINISFLDIMTSRVWSLSMNGELVEDNIPSSGDGYVNSFVVSGDGSTMVMACANGMIKVCSKSEVGWQWRTKAYATVSEKSIHKAIISPDGHYVLSIEDGIIIKVFELEAVEPPSLPLPPLLSPTTPTCSKSLIKLGTNYLKSLVGLKETGCVIL